MITPLTLQAIEAESYSQDRKWGQQNHSPELWLAILVEEVGELAQAILANEFDPNDHNSHHEGMETEAIQIAAVAGQFIECIARNRVRKEMLTNANQKAEG